VSDECSGTEDRKRSQPLMLRDDTRENERGKIGLSAEEETSGGAEVVRQFSCYLISDFYRESLQKSCWALGACSLVRPRLGWAGSSGQDKQLLFMGLGPKP
jgi:hypothetical protein